MNADEIEGNWKQFKGDAQVKWARLTGDDLEQAEGNREKLVGIIQERYGKAKADAEREVDEWFATL